MGQLAKDLQTAHNQNTNRSHNLCGVGKMMMTLEPDDRVALKAAFDNEGVQIIAILRTLQANDIKISYDLLARHRRRSIGSGCRCPSEL